MLKWYRFPKSQAWLFTGSRPFWYRAVVVVWYFVWERNMDPPAKSSPCYCIEAHMLLELSVGNPRNF